MANKELEGPAFNKHEPFGRTYHGEGKPRKIDLECAFLQNGLYYDPNFKLVDCDHNRSILDARSPATAKSAPKESEPVPDLSGESDEVVFRMALNLYNKLTRRGDAPDFEPSVEAREDNLRFLATLS